MPLSHKKTSKSTVKNLASAMYTNKSSPLRSSRSRDLISPIDLQNQGITNSNSSRFQVQQLKTTNQSVNNNMNEHIHGSMHNQTQDQSHQRTCTFPSILYDMIHKVAVEHPYLVRWIENGEAFVMEEKHPLLKKIIEQYFNHSKYSSLQRQLNLYGFKKHVSGRFQGAFHHPMFHYNSCETLHLIQRFPPPIERKRKSQIKVENKNKKSKKVRSAKNSCHNVVNSQMCNRMKVSSSVHKSENEAAKISKSISNNVKRIKNIREKVVTVVTNGKIMTSAKKSTIGKEIASTAVALADDAPSSNNDENNDYLNNSRTKITPHLTTEIRKNDMQDITTITPSMPDLISSEEEEKDHFNMTPLLFSEENYDGCDDDSSLHEASIDENCKLLPNLNYCTPLIDDEKDQFLDFFDLPFVADQSDNDDIFKCNENLDEVTTSYHQKQDDDFLYKINSNLTLNLLDNQNYNTVENIRTLVTKISPSKANGYLCPSTPNNTNTKMFSSFTVMPNSLMTDFPNYNNILISPIVSSKKVNIW